MEDGYAEMTHDGFFAGGSVTVMVVWQFAVPPGPSTVSVYVLVTFGDTARVPLTATAPIPLLIKADVAFEEDQIRVDDSPFLMLGGYAEITHDGFGLKTIVGGGGSFSLPLRSGPSPPQQPSPPPHACSMFAAKTRPPPSDEVATENGMSWKNAIPYAKTPKTSRATQYFFIVCRDIFILDS